MECGTTKRGSTGVHFSDRSWKMVEINRFHLCLSTVFWLFTIFVYFLLPLAPYFLNWPDDAFARSFWRVSFFTVDCGTDLLETLLFCLGKFFPCLLSAVARSNFCDLAEVGLLVPANARSRPLSQTLSWLICVWSLVIDAPPLRLGIPIQKFASVPPFDNRS